MTVIPKKSTGLHIGKDISELADVLIAEVFDIGLLGEHFIPALEHARRNLLTDDAVIIPRAAKIFAMLIECPELRRVHPIKEIAGFDLSDFDAFRLPGYQQVDLNHTPHRALSGVIEVGQIDFSNETPLQFHQSLSIEPVTSGICQAIVFSFDLYLDQDTIISSRAETKTNHWKQSLQFFESDRTVRPGEPVILEVHQSQTGIEFCLN